MNLKTKEFPEEFVFNWVLINRLLIGSAPKNKEHIKILKSLNIDFILSLCSEEEAPIINELHLNFKNYQIILPDHKSSENISKNQIKKTVERLDLLLQDGNVFIHCYAGIERSPLIIIAWLVKTKKLKLIEAIEYLKGVHPPSRPLQKHLYVLNKYQFNET